MCINLPMSTAKEIIEWSAAAVVVGGALVVSTVKYLRIGRGSPEAMKPLQNPELLAQRKKADVSLQKIAAPADVSPQI